MASKGVNKVILVGNLGQDPEVRYMPNGNAVANLSIATSESWKDQQGQMQERTEWHRLTMYRRLAEVAGEYLRKGSQIYVEGKLQTRKWQDQQGQDKYTTEVIVDQMQMLGGKSGGQSEGGFQGQQRQQPLSSALIKANNRLTSNSLTKVIISSLLKVAKLIKVSIKRHKAVKISQPLWLNLTLTLMMIFRSSSGILLKCKLKYFIVN